MRVSRKDLKRDGSEEKEEKGCVSKAGEAAGRDDDDPFKMQLVLASLAL